MRLVVVSGRSGSGKSTLLAILGALDRPTSGQVTVAGQAYGELTAPMREVGALLDAATEPDDLAIGTELGERLLEQLDGFVGVVAADEVGRHVVGRAERRAEAVGAARHQRRHLVERHEGRPEHDGIAILAVAHLSRRPGYWNPGAR